MIYWFTDLPLDYGRVDFLKNHQRHSRNFNIKIHYAALLFRCVFGLLFMTVVPTTHCVLFVLLVDSSTYLGDRKASHLFVTLVPFITSNIWPPVNNAILHSSVMCTIFTHDSFWIFGQVNLIILLLCEVLRYSLESWLNEFRCSELYNSAMCS